MSEIDVVEQLRAIADWFDQPLPPSDPPPSIPLPKMLRMAADEIEMLRGEIESIAHGF